MPRFQITAQAEGDAVLIVEADDEEAAEELAYQEHLCGIRIEGGEATWIITNTREVNG